MKPHLECPVRCPVAFSYWFLALRVVEVVSTGGGRSVLLGLFDCLDRDVVSLLHAAITRVVFASTVQANGRVSHRPDPHFLLAALTS